MKEQFDRKLAIAAARTMIDHLKPLCIKIKVAGSLRRGKLTVGDVEMLYVPIYQSERDGLFDKNEVNLVDRELDAMIGAGILEKRLNKNRQTTWGDQIKLARHVKTGVPVDLFQTNQGSWWNQLVCRTGGEQNNILIATSAKKKGLKWCPFKAGFEDSDGNQISVGSEEEVYQIVGLRFLEPHQRR